MVAPVFIHPKLQERRSLAESELLNVRTIAIGESCVTSAFLLSGAYFSLRSPSFLALLCFSFILAGVRSFPFLPFYFLPFPPSLSSNLIHSPFLYCTLSVLASHSDGYALCNSYSTCATQCSDSDAGLCNPPCIPNCRSHVEDSIFCVTCSLCKRLCVAIYRVLRITLDEYVVIHS